MFIDKKCPRCDHSLREDPTTNEINCFFCEGYKYGEISQHAWAFNKATAKGSLYCKEDDFDDDDNINWINPDYSLGVDEFIFITSWEYTEKIRRRVFFKASPNRRLPIPTYFREIILRRDGYKCQDCGSYMDLHVHHIIPISQNPDLQFDFQNLITVCRYCHGKKHNHEVPLYEGYDFSL